VTSYCTINELQDALRITDTVDSEALATAIQAASARIDAHCGRTFDQADSASVRRFDVVDAAWRRPSVQSISVRASLLLVDDIATTAGLLVNGDPIGDRFTPDPLNALAKDEPVTALRINNGALLAGTIADVTAVWGWPSVPVAIRQATIILAGRYFKRFDSLLGVAGFGDLGAIMVRNVDPDVEALIARYRRGDTGFGIA
jgi:hypothetical protein